jgi:ribonuclease P protein component
LNRDHRLKRAADFRAIREGGKSWADRLLVVAATRRERGNDEATPPSRFGFSVGKRIGNAVQRNRTKRRLRSAVAGAYPGPGWDVLIIARKRLIGSEYLEIQKSMTGLLRRAGVSPMPDGPTDSAPDSRAGNGPA